MKGPAVFFGSLLAVGVLGVLVLRPGLEEKTRLAERIRGRGPSAAAEEEPGRAAAARLRAILAPASGPPLDAVLDGLDAGAPSRPAPRAMVFDLPWAHLPDLLVRLCAPGLPPVEELHAESTPKATRCRVRLKFSPLPRSGGSR